VKYAWINQHRDSFPSGLMCDVLAVSKSGFYADHDEGRPDEAACAEQARSRLHGRRTEPEVGHGYYLSADHPGLGLPVRRA
jgi:hypothetical protein